MHPGRACLRDQSHTTPKPVRIIHASVPPIQQHRAAARADPNRCIRVGDKTTLANKHNTAQQAKSNVRAQVEALDQLHNRALSRS